MLAALLISIVEYFCVYVCSNYFFFMLCCSVGDSSIIANKLFTIVIPNIDYLVPTSPYIITET